MIRAIWVTIGVALTVCIVMCSIRDSQGDEQAAWGWAGACIGLFIVAMFVYAFEYAPWWRIVDGRPMTEFEGRPWYDEPEFPVVYDQSIDTRM